MKKLSNVLPIVVVILTSCELIVDIEVPYDGDKIVLNGIQSPDQPWTIEMTRSRYILDEARYDFLPITQGDVTVYGDDGSVLKLDSIAQGMFSTNTYPLEGHTYSIVVKSPGLEDVQSELTMPYPVRIKSVAWDSSEVNPNPNPQFYNYSNMSLEVTFDDPADEKNYYGILLGIHSTITYQNPDMTERRTDSLTYYREAAIFDPAIGSEDERPRRFSDRTFNGRTYTAHSDVQVQTDPDSKIYRIDVMLVTVSEELFRYEESRNLYDEVDGDPFAQPVQVYSNVANGFGIFAGTTRDVMSWHRTP
jgi:hypothetical protein